MDACTQCANYGDNLLLNSCPANAYKTNVRCTADSQADSTCAACKSNCRAGLNGTSDAGQFISKTCDGTGNSPEVQCADCTQMCGKVPDLSFIIALVLHF